MNYKLFFTKMKSSKAIPAILGFCLFSAVDFSAHAQNRTITYISSSTGFVLYRSGTTAVTADWAGQKPIANFTGYGQISMDNLCLTGNNGNRPLTWEACGNNPGQRWGISNGQLRNERGWCADLQGNRNGAGVPVLAWNCSGSLNQRWKAHYPNITRAEIARAASRITDPALRASVEKKLNSVGSNGVLIFTAQEALALNRAGLIGLDAASLISAGGLGLISAGGLGFTQIPSNLVSPTYGTKH